MSSLAVLAAAFTCQAALVWSGTAAEIKAVPGQEKAVVEFAFRNEGARTVRLVSLRPSCDCTTATPSKESFAPGEAGIVRVEFTLGGRLGRQEKTVTVTTDEPNEKPVELLLVVDIPELVSLQPRMLFWAAGAPPEEKTIAVAVAEPDKATVTEARCEDARFVVTLAPGKERGTYQLAVRPAETSHPAQAVIRVTTQVDGKPLVSVIYVTIR